MISTGPLAKAACIPDQKLELKLVDGETLKVVVDNTWREFWDSRGSSCRFTGFLQQRKLIATNAQRVRIPILMISGVDGLKSKTMYCLLAGYNNT
jgi:hypothetical protein